MTALRACTGRVAGRVQGVGFRYATIREANRLGVAGWVGNRFDGSVEFFVQGPSVAVDAMLDFLAHGPPGARVDHLTHKPAPVDEGLVTFGLD